MRNNDNHDTSPAATTTPALKSTTALITVAGLKTILGGIDRSAALQSGRPMLQFKSREDGTWRYGIKGNEVEEGSQWAINVLTFMHGYICFGPDNKVIGERMVPSREPKPDFASLPNLGARWQDQTTVDVKCCTGTDAGVEATLKMTSDGGGKFMANLVVAIDNRAA